MPAAQRAPRRPRAKRTKQAEAPPDAPLPHEEHPEGQHAAFAALASHTRYQILDALSGEPKSVTQLAGEIGIHRLTLRYHLGFLLKEGFVEELPGGHHKGAGRPARLYRTARHSKIPGFPPRRFEFIAQAALGSLLEALGEGDARRLLHNKGVEVGKQIVGQIATAKNVGRWTPQAFEEHVLRGSYRDMGVSTQVLSSTPTTVEYRAHGCPFLELAEQMPDVVCDALDTGFHDGMDEALGATTIRRACMGHGDLYCEYALEWRAKGGRARAAKAAPAGAPPDEGAGA